MKKKMLLAIALMLSSVGFGVNRIQVVINYGNGIYNGYTYDRILMEEEDFLKDKARYEGRFFEGLMESYPGVAYAPDSISQSEPIAYVEIVKVTKKGNVTAEVTCGDKKEVLQGKGGVFGTFMNLFGDGMESLGRSLARVLPL